MIINDDHVTLVHQLAWKPKRKRRSVGHSMWCVICEAAILPRHRYYDGGPGHRAHDVCVEAVIRREKKP